MKKETIGKMKLTVREREEVRMEAHSAYKLLTERKLVSSKRLKANGSSE